MRIESTDRNCWIEILRNEEESFPSFSYECFVDIRHGEFRGKNCSILFQGCDEFISAFDSFIMNRTLDVRLEGTYDSFLEFSSGRNLNEIVLRFTVGDSFAGYRNISSFKVGGAFEINAEFLNQYISQFKGLFHA